jgi:hypothetical protein
MFGADRQSQTEKRNGKAGRSAYIFLPSFARDRLQRCLAALRQRARPLCSEPVVNRHLLYHALREALLSGQCPVCRLVAAGAEQRLRHLFHESVNDPLVRETLRGSLGYCVRHAEMAASLGDVCGVAILYRDILSAGSGTRLRSPSSCPECLAEQADEQRCLHALAHDLRDPDMQAAYRQSNGLCIPHLEPLLALTASEVAAFLISQEEARLAALVDELDEFIRKYDYRFAHEPADAERDSWRRALQKVAGARGKQEERGP